MDDPEIILSAVLLWLIILVFALLCFWRYKEGQCDTAYIEL